MILCDSEILCTSAFVCGWDLIVLSIHLRGPTDLRYFDLLGRYLRSADLIACLNIWDIWDLGDILEIYFAALNRNCSQNYEGNAGETYNADCGLRLNLSGTLARPFVSFVRPGVLGCCCLKDPPIFGRKFPVPYWNTGGYTIALVWRKMSMKPSRIFSGLKTRMASTRWWDRFEKNRNISVGYIPFKKRSLLYCHIPICSAYCNVPPTQLVCNAN